MRVLRFNLLILSMLTIFSTANAERFDAINFHGCCMVRSMYCGMNYDYSPPRCSGLTAPNGETCMMDAGCINAYASSVNLIENFYLPCEASSPQCNESLAALQLLSFENGGSCKRNKRSGAFECVRGSVSTMPRTDTSAY